MAESRNIRISRNFGVRDTKTYTMGDIWYVDEGEPYDLVQFSIKEIEGFMWPEALCVPCGTSEKEIDKLVKEKASAITEADIDEFKNFVEFGKTFGWD